MPETTVPPDAALRCGNCHDVLSPDAETFATDHYGDICGTCRDGLPACYSCGDVGVDLEEDVNGDDNCTSCTRSMYSRTTCDHCGRPGSYYDMRSATVGEICSDCAGNEFWECANCEYLIRSGDYCGDCEEDYGEAEDSGEVHGYNYTPDPNFLGEGPVYLGFELEISTPRGSLDAIASGVNAALNHGDWGYLKEDSSIAGAGFEIVTHPMSHDWSSRHFPWDILDDLKRDGCAANPDSNGLHVHVSRDGFSGPAHVLRWLQMFYDSRERVIKIARRNTDEWASWHGSNSDTYNAKRHAKGSTAGHRYSAINVQNRHTFEVRAFGSTLDKTELRAALDLVAASVEYTREITAAVDVDVDDDAAWDAFADSDTYRAAWDAFAAYVAERDTYLALHTMISKEA